MDESDSYSVLFKVGICSHTERFSQSVPEPEYQSLIAPTFVSLARACRVDREAPACQYPANE